MLNPYHPGTRKHLAKVPGILSWHPINPTKALVRIFQIFEFSARAQ